METELRTMVNPIARGSTASRVRSHVPQPLANRLGPLVQPTLSSPRSILGKSTWDERWPTLECGSPGNCEHCSSTYKDATGSKVLTSGSCSGDRYE